MNLNYVIDKNRERLVYVCCPFNPDTMRATQNDVAEKLRSLSFIPVLPDDLFEGIDKDQLIGHFIIEGQVSALAKCPIMVTVDGWEKDAICKMEVQIARLMGKRIIPIVNLEKELGDVNHKSTELSALLPDAEHRALSMIDTGFKGY